MRLPLVVAFLLSASMIGAAAAQHTPVHGPRAGQRPAAPGPPNEWTQLLIEALSLGTGVEQWRKKDVMRCRIAIELEPPSAREAEADGDETAQAAANVPALSIHGTVTFDVPGRRLRLDVDDGLSFLVERDGSIAIWPRDADVPPIARENVPDEALHAARSLSYLLPLPLRLTDPETRFGPGGHTELLDERLYTSVLVVHHDDTRAEADEEHAAPEYPPDWYAFYVTRPEPHRLRVVAYMAHDRSKPMTEFPRPRAAVFEAYHEVEGVAVPRAWTIWNFSRVDRITGDAIGSAKVRDVEFADRAQGMFEAPARALRVR